MKAVWLAPSEMCGHADQLVKAGLIEWGQAMNHETGGLSLVPMLRSRRKGQPFAWVYYCPLCGEKNFRVEPTQGEVDA